MNIRGAVKPLKTFIDRMEALRDNVSTSLDMELESIIEQARVLQGETDAFFDSWEGEIDFPGVDIEDDEGPDDDDDDGEDDAIDKDFEDVT